MKKTINVHSLEKLEQNLKVDDKQQKQPSGTTLPSGYMSA